MIEKKFIKESIKRLKTKDYISKELEKAGIVDVDIQRTTLTTRIGVVAERPGLVIGRKGSNIQIIVKALEEKLGIENPQIEVTDVSNPSLEPRVICRMIKRMVERGMKPRRVTKRALSRIMAAGAMGAEIIVDGSPSKGSRSRKERAAQGYLKKAGDSVKHIRMAKEQAVLKQGVLGITVRIVPPDVIFPDKIDIKKATGFEAEEVEEPVEKETEEKTGIEELAEEVKPTPEEKEAAEKVLEEVKEEQKKAKKKKPKKAEKEGAAEEKSEEFKCEECGKTFKSKRGLSIHGRVHKK